MEIFQHNYAMYAIFLLLTVQVTTLETRSEEQPRLNILGLCVSTVSLVHHLNYFSNQLVCRHVQSFSDFENCEQRRLLLS